MDDSASDLQYEPWQSVMQTSEEICSNDQIPVGECSNFDQTNCVCIIFQQSIGFQNIWLIYSLLVAVSLGVSAIYSCLISCKFPHVKKFIKWDVGIFFCNITVWFWVPCIIFSQFCYVDFVCFWHVFLFFPLVLTSFVLSLVDMCFSPLAKLLRRQGKKTEETLQFLERLRAAPPDISVEIQCYHDKTRYAGFRSQIVEKVTHKEKRIFPIDGFTDQSQIPPVKQEPGITMIQIYKTITAGDNYSQAAFNQFRDEFISANTMLDQGIHDTNVLSVAGMVEDMVMTCQGCKPWWARSCSFYLLSILNIGIILRFVKNWSI